MMHESLIEPIFFYLFLKKIKSKHSRFQTYKYILYHMTNDTNGKFRQIDRQTCVSEGIQYYGNMYEAKMWIFTSFLSCDHNIISWGLILIHRSHKMIYWGLKILYCGHNRKKVKMSHLSTVQEKVWNYAALSVIKMGLSVIIR